MASLLRQLRHPNKWWPAEPLAWLNPGESPADPLPNFSTSANTLSFYVVGDDISRIEKIAAAVAVKSQRTEFEAFDYILFEQEVITNLGIKTDNSKGKTADTEVNQWHLDLVELTAGQIAALANKLVPTCIPDVVLPKRVEQVLVERLSQNKIPIDEIENKNKKASLRAQMQIGPGS